MSPDRLVSMANQIGIFFGSQRHADPAIGIADHMRKFWDPGMRQALAAHVANGGSGVNPAVLRAVQSLGH